MKRYLLHPMLLTLTLATAAPTSARAQTSRDRVAVVALDENSATRPIVSGTISVLNENDYETLNTPELQIAIDRAKIVLEQVDTTALAEASGLLETGTRKMNFEGENAALPSLEQGAEVCMQSEASLAAKPAIAQRCFDAMILLGRAYFKLGRLVDAQTVASQLVTTFPGQPVDVARASEGFANEIETVRKELAEQNTTLTFYPYSAPDLGECKIYVNGLQIEGNGPYFVDAERTYVLQQDCGRTPTRLAWRYSPRANQSNAVPLIDTEPLVMGMKDGGKEAREAVEQRIQFVFFWTDIDSFVGVSRNGASESDDSVLLARASRQDSQIQWSDRPRPAYCEELSGFFPRVSFAPGGVCEAAGLTPPPETRPRVAPIAATGLGVVAAGVGATLWVLNEREVDRVRCSPYFADAGDTCVGVDAYSTDEVEELAGSADPDDLDALRAQLLFRRNLGLGLTAAGGVLAIAGGVWWAVGGRAEQPTRALRVTPTQGGAAVDIQLRF